LLQSWAQANQPVLTDAEFDNLRVDMTHLFSGLGKVKAPPWESVHFGQHRLVFQERTRQVRVWYRRYGLEVENPYVEPDDHIGLELAFLAHLAKLSIQCLDGPEGTARFEQLLEAQKAFLQEHLLGWVFIWVGQLQKHSKTSFYQGLALLTRGAVLHLAGLLDIAVIEETGK
jgi:TorA maturation chaperone TorD